MTTEIVFESVLKTRETDGPQKQQKAVPLHVTDLRSSVRRLIADRIGDLTRRVPATHHVFFGERTVMNRWEAFTKIIATLPPAERAGVVRLGIIVLGAVPTATVIAFKLLP